jgi:predicted amidohydrolase
VALLTLALAQIDTRLGDLRANAERHLERIEEARSKGAKLIVFPELSLTGYALQDLAPTVAINPASEHPIFNQLLSASKEIDIVVGFVETEERGRYYISAAYLSRGQLTHIHRKVYLPTYGLFDEGRFFAFGNRIQAFDTQYGRFGLLICEDFWHASPPYLLWLDGADMLILIPASPGRGLRESERLESAAWVERIIQAYASLFTSHVLHTNRVGFEDGLHFWGGATVHSPDGELITRGPYHQEDLVIARIDQGQLRRTRARLPLLRDERPEVTLRELERILHHDHRREDA